MPSTELGNHIFFYCVLFCKLWKVIIAVWIVFCQAIQIWKSSKYFLVLTLPYRLTILAHYGQDLCPLFIIKLNYIIPLCISYIVFDANYFWASFSKSWTLQRQGVLFCKLCSSSEFVMRDCKTILCIPEGCLMDVYKLCPYNYNKIID